MNIEEAKQVLESISEQSSQEERYLKVEYVKRILK